LSAGLPREIAPGIYWLGDCLEVEYRGEIIHGHASAYLLMGARETLLVDTGHPIHWQRVEHDLAQVLGSRGLDWIVPTHAELPHAGNLHRLARRYPGSRVLGDVRDYHLFFPQLAGRFREWPKDQPLDLGGGYQVVLVDAPLKDLVTTQWAYETSQQVLFVADGFGYMHARPDLGSDQPTHRPGECSMLSTEWPEPPGIEHAAFLTRAALNWTRFVDDAEVFEAVASVLDRYPPRLVAPAHGNVIADFDAFFPIVREAHRLAYGGSRSDPVPAPAISS
jgi:hypothetical protein